MGTVELITDHAFKGVIERGCEWYPSEDPEDEWCGLPMSRHADQSKATLDSHAWLGPGPEGGSNTLCHRDRCTELRLAKIHSGFGVEFLETEPAEEGRDGEVGTGKTIIAGLIELYSDEEEEHEYEDKSVRRRPIMFGAPNPPAAVAFNAHAEATLELVRSKDLAYGGAWEKQGYMGNLARVLSKVERLKNMVWGDTLEDWNAMGAEESVMDTLHDLMALAAFMATNIEEGNRWGS